MTHTLFLANKEISKKLIELEDVYKKIDCNLSERTFGILVDYLSYHFHKNNIRIYFYL